VVALAIGLCQIEKRWADVRFTHFFDNNTLYSKLEFVREEGAHYYKLLETIELCLPAPWEFTFVWVITVVDGTPLALVCIKIFGEALKTWKDMREFTNSAPTLV
jgi:hypothetical protein